MNYFALAALPPTDPLRNKPLLEIQAEYRDHGSKVWKKIERNFAIARTTFNNLGTAWLNSSDWRAPESTA
jgi:hypothetical protein